MQVATFDIWSGTRQSTGEWLETVGELGNARKRMQEIATKTPGQYFIFSSWNGYIVDEIDTREGSLVRLHYHIRWSGKVSLDWQQFRTPEEANREAAYLAQPGESFTIEECSKDCLHRLFRAQTNKVRSTAA